MSKRIRDHLRSNVVGYIALFFVLSGGTAYALDGSNTVFSDDIVNGEVKTADIGGGEVQTSDLGANAVTSAKINDGTILSADIGDSQVTPPNLRSNSVTNSKVADNAVQNAQIADNAVTSGKIGDGEVNAQDISSAPPFGSGGFNGDEKIQDGTILGFDIASNQITSSKVADGSLSNADLSVFGAEVNADGTIATSSGGVTGTKLGTGTYEVDFPMNLTQGNDGAGCWLTANPGGESVFGASAGDINIVQRSGNVNGVFVTTFDNANALADKHFQMMAVC